MVTLTDEQEYTRIRQLPVIRELEKVYGKPPFEHLVGAPVPGRISGWKVRMPWVWFVDGKNLNLAVDHGGEWPWTIRATGRAGRITFRLGAGERITHTMLRAVCVAAGLLDYPEPAQASAGCDGLHGDTWFDRELCAEPCGKMHTRCIFCGRPVDGCTFETVPGNTTTQEEPCKES